MLSGLVNRLFRNVQTGDYLYVFGVEGDRVLGVVVEEGGLKRGKRVRPARVFVYLGEFAKTWREVATEEDVLRDLMDSTVDVAGVVIELRPGRCPIHGDSGCGKDKPTGGEKLN